MAFKKLESAFNTLMLSKKQKSVEGYLVGADYGIGKYKSTVLRLDDGKGNIRRVWSNGQLDQALCGGRKSELYPAMIGKKFRFTWKGLIPPTKKGESPMNDIEIEIDDDAKPLNTGREYIMRPDKKAKKKVATDTASE